MSREIKVTTVGDGMVGKTCILTVFQTKRFPLSYIPTVVEEYSKEVSFDGATYKLILWDTAGQEEYDRLRPLAYPGTDVFLLCYSIENENSYENVKHRWIKELKHFNPSTPILLVGTKIDLREDEKYIGKCYERKDGLKLMKEIKARQYVECSAMKGIGVQEIFHEAVKVAMGLESGGKKTNKKNKRSCTLI